jgi:SAM-dependent methyltransferase
MKVSCYLSRLLTLLLVTAACQHVKAQQNDFEPSVGQAGKDVVWVPTPQALVDKMLEMAKVTSSDYVMDLGSGDGRTVIAAARLGATALGVEYNPDMVELSRKNAAEAGVSEKARFIQADLFETDLSKATVITMFLLPAINMRLRPTILDLKQGTRIVSNTFTMQDWEPDETFMLENCYSWCTALLWIVPAKVAGTWKSAAGEIKIEQEFQNFSGTITKGDKVVTITNGKLTGEQISFTADGATYSGRVSGNSMSGTFTKNGDKQNWSAVM